VMPLGGMKPGLCADRKCATISTGHIHTSMGNNCLVPSPKKTCILHVRTLSTLDGTGMQVSYIT
jgi:hypothetical protein